MMPGGGDFFSVIISKSHGSLRDLCVTSLEDIAEKYFSQILHVLNQNENFILFYDYHKEENDADDKDISSENSGNDRGDEKSYEGFEVVNQPAEEKGGRENNNMAKNTKRRYKNLWLQLFSTLELPFAHQNEKNYAVEYHYDAMYPFSFVLQSKIEEARLQSINMFKEKFLSRDNLQLSAIRTLTDVIPPFLKISNFLFDFHSMEEYLCYMHDVIFGMEFVRKSNSRQMDMKLVEHVCSILLTGWSVSSLYEHQMEQKQNEDIVVVVQEVKHREERGWLKQLRHWHLHAGLWMMETLMKRILRIVTELDLNPFDTLSVQQIVEGGGGRYDENDDDNGENINPLPTILIQLVESIIQRIKRSLDAEQFDKTIGRISKEINDVFAFLYHFMRPNFNQKTRENDDEQKLQQPSPLLQRLKMSKIQYQQLSLVHIFTRDIALPLSIPQNQYQTVCDQFSANDFLPRTAHSLKTVFNALTVLLEEYEITSSTIANPTPKLKQMLNKCKDFIELYLSQFCLGDIDGGDDDDPDQDLMDILVTIVFDPDVNIPFERLLLDNQRCKTIAEQMLRRCTISTRMEIIRRLDKLQHRKKNEKEGIMVAQKIEAYLTQVIHNTRFEDNMGARILVNNMENKIILEEADIKQLAHHIVTAMKQEKKEQERKRKSPLDKLLRIAQCRVLIQIIAEQCRLRDEKKMEKKEEKKEEKKGEKKGEKKEREEKKEEKGSGGGRMSMMEEEKITYLLSDEQFCTDFNYIMTGGEGEGNDSNFVRQLNLFFIKELVRCIGFQKTQVLVTTELVKNQLLSFLTKPPIFVILSPLPSNAPNFDSFVLLGDRYVAIKQLVVRLVTTERDNEIKEHKMDANDKASILAAFFQECYYRHVIQKIKGDAFDGFMTSLQNRNILKGTEMPLLRKLVSNFDEKSVMRMEPQTPLDRLLIIRIGFHLVITVLALPENCSPFRRLLYDPASLQNEFIVGMPPDIMSMLRAALREGTNLAIWECECGYKYFIGECTRPMQNTKCPNCTRMIGGTNHNPEAGQKVAVARGQAGESPKGYVIQAIDASMSYRNLTPLSLNVLRFFIDSLLLYSYTVLNPESVKKFMKIPTNTDTMLVAQLQAQFRNIQQLLRMNVEDASLGLHLIIQQFGQVAANVNTAGFHSCTTEQLRTAFELFFTNSCVNAISNNLANQIGPYSQKASDVRQDILKIIIDEINERIDLKSNQGITYRNDNLPFLYLSRNNINLHAFASHVLSNHNLKQSHPVLYFIMTHLPNLRPAKFLPQIVSFQQMLYTRYNRREFRVSARGKSMQRVLEEFGPLAKQLKEYYEGFRSAWNLVAERVRMKDDPHFPKVVLRHECKELLLDKLPKDPNNVPLVLALTSNRDEGLYILEIIRAIIDFQNNFLTELRDFLKASAANPNSATRNPPEGDEMKESGNAYASLLSILDRALSYGIDSSIVMDHDVIQINERELEGFIYSQTNQTFDYGNNKLCSFNYSIIEQYIVETCLRSFSYLFMNSSFFLFAGELNSKTNLKDYETINPVRLELSQKMRKLILDELHNTNQLRHVYVCFDECISFMKNMKISDVDQPLGQFLIKVLKMDDFVNQLEFFKSNSEETTVCVAHLSSLFSLLDDAIFEQEGATVPDTVDVDFQGKLDDKQKTSWMGWLKTLSVVERGELVRKFREFLSLGQGTGNPKQKLVDWLPALIEQDWIYNLPDIPLGCSADAYELAAGLYFNKN